MNLNTMVFIIIFWIAGLAFTYKLAEAGYPWLAVLVLIILGSMRVRWGDDKKDEEE